MCWITMNMDRFQSVAAAQLPLQLDICVIGKSGCAIHVLDFLT